MAHTIFLRSHRKRWGLTQDELGALLGISRSAITKTEAGTRLPSARLILATEVVFGVSASEIFPSLHTEVITEVGLVALAMDRQLSGPGPVRPASRYLVEQLLKRAKSHSHPLWRQPTLFEQKT